MSANERQVGGQHYAGAAQHWDMANSYFGPGYLAGQVTKYVTRWRKKNGVQDLEKAAHFLQKLREVDWDALGWKMQRKIIPVMTIEEYCSSNKLSPTEERIIGHITRWELAEADQLLQLILEEARDSEPTRAYVDQR